MSGEFREIVMADITEDFTEQVQQLLDEDSQKPALWARERLWYFMDGSTSTSLFLCDKEDTGAIPLFRKPNPGLFVSRDGLFMCDPNHAGEVAYMISCAEAAINRNPSDSFAVSQIIGEYLTGQISVDDAMTKINA
jgi:hypothetical protein